MLYSIQHRSTIVDGVGDLITPLGLSGGAQVMSMEVNLGLLLRPETTPGTIQKFNITLLS